LARTLPLIFLKYRAYRELRHGAKRVHGSY
jgi:hypothetical protein